MCASVCVQISCEISWDRGRKFIGPGHLLFFINTVNLREAGWGAVGGRGGGAFSRDFTSFQHFGNKIILICRNFLFLSLRRFTCSALNVDGMTFMFCLVTLAMTSEVRIGV